MGVLQNKIDFEGIIVVENANCNGDPLNGNMPRVTYEGYGEMSDVCIKRKIRNRLLDAGENIFVQSDDKCIDKCKSLKARAEANEAFGAELKKGKKADAQRGYEIACKEWMDVRSFGQVFAFKGSDLSLGIRGPVSVQPAFSVDPIDITSMQLCFHQYNLCITMLPSGLAEELSFTNRVHNSIEIKKKEGVRNPRKIEDYEIICHELPGLAVEEYEGL